ncbi:hypothetical protein BV98_001246 [Sphingobium herbicidovorans NBRC 16415]|uniref:Uncharacterized protein n=1 Tax=Sphingobium herbicidovorans (strain ATCC 700291 / DSM 11019 / CCUG 56400 / KCTC 2939 / LMG 18315 / NBRC 16415 / MH) TaxID=1219045 RepID=A0A086PBW1_SPHHM|nr:hypothetical protein BV98_001246 [Sphingobium herbicidovorans NBRC 16415]
MCRISAQVVSADADLPEGIDAKVGRSVQGRKVLIKGAALESNVCRASNNGPRVLG